MSHLVANSSVYELSLKEGESLKLTLFAATRVKFNQQCILGRVWLKRYAVRLSPSYTARSCLLIFET